MTMTPLLIYEINTVAWLEQLSKKYSSVISLENVPLKEWQDISASGNYNAIWLMGVWKRSKLASKINLEDQDFLAEVNKTLVDFDPDKDLIGSAYSIADYVVSDDLGGSKGLDKTREQLKSLGLKLILDFVPNHVAIDHSWVSEHPEYFFQVDERTFADNPELYRKVNDHYFALGRDPNQYPWSDVLQLNIFNIDLVKAQINIIRTIATQCDGIRCDMAMLLLEGIFTQTWKNLIVYNSLGYMEYWTRVISMIKKDYPDFIFLAECYWDTQDQLIMQGFDYCYDKDFYDHLVSERLDLLTQSLSCPLETQLRSVRFLENHDEPRSAIIFNELKLKAVIILLGVVPSSKLYYEGQLSGRRVRTPVQIARDPEQSIDKALNNFYNLVFQSTNSLMANLSSWRLYKCTECGNDLVSWQVLSCGWQDLKFHYLAIVNLSSYRVNTEIITDFITRQNLSTKVLVNSIENELNLKFVDNKTLVELGEYQGVIIRISI